MIKSMTGYGRVREACDGLTLVVELRSVNHRFLDLSLRLPKHLQFLEPSLKKILQARFSRGHIDLIVQLEGGEKQAARLVLDRDLTQQYHRILMQLREELGLQEKITLSHFVHNRDLIHTVEINGNFDKQARLVEKLLFKAADTLEAARLSEGRQIDKDLKARLQGIEQAVAKIEQRLPDLISSYQKRLRSRIRELTGGMTLDPHRLAQEVALFAERSDISEEISRFRSHVKQFKLLLRRRDPVGRSLDFLLQEMGREVNTLGSKAGDSVVSHQVVYLKTELEKLREQVQNVE